MNRGNQKFPGGLVVGETDKNGEKGIKVVAPEGDILVGGGELVLTSDTGKSNKIHEFDGKEMTPCEIASELNYEHGGVKIPCQIAEAANTTDSKMEVGDVIKRAENGIKVSGESTVGKVKMKSITIHWAEGKEYYVRMFPKTYTSWEEANLDLTPLFVWDGIGYNKAKFSVTFDDGEVYTGRVDISSKHDNPMTTKNVIGKHIDDGYRYALSLPEINDEEKIQIREWLDKYDLGPETRGSMAIGGEVKSKKIIRRNLPINKEYKLIDSFYTGGLIENPMACDNCDRPIANVAVLEDEDGKK